jgi:hypothetical protein
MPPVANQKLPHPFSTASKRRLPKLTIIIAAHASRPAANLYG